MIPKAAPRKILTAMDRDKLLGGGETAKVNLALSTRVRRAVRLDPKTEVVQGPSSGEWASARPRGMGRGRGTISFREADPAPITIRHERAHLAPKRNSYRFRQRYADHRSAGREEARADHLAGYKPGEGYSRALDTKDPKFAAGYREVRGKMLRAGTKTKVNKRLSAFGVIW